MQRYKIPKKTIFDHLIHDNYFLTERYNETLRMYNESVKMVEILQKDVDYLNNFIFSTYDLSTNNYIGNLKIVAYDASDNIIKYICTDSSGNFSSTIQLGTNLQNIPYQDVSKNEMISDMSRCYPYDHFPYHYPPYYHFPHHRYRYRDIDEDRGITSKPTKVIHSTTVNGVVTNKDEESRCLYPYGCFPYCDYPYDHYPYGDYPYGDYPYGLLDENDYRNVTINHPYHPPPQYPIVNPPVNPPIIHRDLIDHSLMHKQYEFDNVRFSQSPYHIYKNK